MVLLDYVDMMCKGKHVIPEGKTVHEPAPGEVCESTFSKQSVDRFVTRCGTSEQQMPW